MSKLWGDWYYNPNGRKFTRNSIDENGAILKRAFSHFVLDMI